MKLGIKEAEEILREAEGLNPGSWIEHSKNVALAARLIADKDQGLNSEKAYILGLLHDIGRRKYISGMEHVLYGHAFMQEKGHEEIARICMTHTFPYKDVNAIYGDWGYQREEAEIVEKYIKDIEYDDYDLLIQLCDSLSMPDGFTLIEKRFVNTALRSGISNLIVYKWNAVMDIKKYFEGKIGCSVYKLLPNIVQNTFETF
ncbi:metal-dependent phosphohydrolase HD sub domain containing protein [Clostridium sp. DL-VIII]|uniref:HD domain-containing protein n=1 Tax=Clostridium sp. DL-VIII TaxID=641107 RepID=UPI00023AFABE|nr:HD domain-containing protein [Clostridium sp. DL-VIII]EHJ00659.1 metal-dependent phosphohydrolase HD sub domain containing protein [Clostridium sp. DL-VIII]